MGRITSIFYREGDSKGPDILEYSGRGELTEKEIRLQCGCKS